jgi:hypothetical protein
MAGPQSVSVVIPTVGSAYTLDRALASAAAQEHAPCELLLVSDGPATAYARAVAARYGAELLELPPAGHPSPGRQLATARARGRFVAYLDHDDAWAPDHLTRLLELETDVAVAGAEHVDERGTVVGHSTLLAAVWHPAVLAGDPFAEPSRVLCRTAAVLAAGGWRRGIGLEDWDLWQRMSAAGARVACHAQPTARLTRSTRSRRYSVRPTGRLELARLPAGEEPLSVDPGAASSARLQDSQEWLDWLLAQEETVLPADCDATAIRASLGDEVGFDARMATEAVGGETRVFVPVFANSRAGAAAALAALERRHARELAVLREAFVRGAVPVSANCAG